MEDKIKEAAEKDYSKQIEPETSKFECFFHYTDKLLYESAFIEGVKSQAAKKYWFEQFKELFKEVHENGFCEALDVNSLSYNFESKIFEEWYNKQKEQL